MSAEKPVSDHKKTIDHREITIASHISPGEFRALREKESFYEKFGFQRLPSEKYGHGMALDIIVSDRTEPKDL